MTRSIDEITAEINSFVDKINQDLQLPPSSKLFSNTLPLGMATALISYPNDLTNLVNGAIEQNRLLDEIALITGKTTDEIMEFCQSHPCSLEDVKYMAMMGNKLGGGHELDATF